MPSSGPHPMFPLCLAGTALRATSVSIVRLPAQQGAFVLRTAAGASRSRRRAACERPSKHPACGKITPFAGRPEGHCYVCAPAKHGTRISPKIRMNTDSVPDVGNTPSAVQGDDRSHPPESPVQQLPCLEVEFRLSGERPVERAVLVVKKKKPPVGGMPTFRQPSSPGGMVRRER